MKKTGKSIAFDKETKARPVKLEKPKTASEPEESEKIRPLKQEIKSLDLLYSLVLQWCYANFLLKETTSIQEKEASGQLFDRGKQVIELKKQVSGLNAEYTAREKNRLLDDILSMEYSSLKAVEEDILVCSNYLHELEDTSYNFINKVELDEGVVISPQDFSENLEQTAYLLKNLSSFMEDETNEIEALASDFQMMVDVVNEQDLVLNQIFVLKQEIDLALSQERINIAEALIDKRETVLQNILIEELM